MLARPSMGDRARPAAQAALRGTLRIRYHGIHFRAPAISPRTGLLVPGIYRRSANLGNVRPSHSVIHIRTFLNGILPPALIPPTVFVGLLVALWTYKCMMTVLFQDKIIYMPYMPPFARAERIDDYAARCKPVEWQKEMIMSLDNTRISLCIGSIPPEDPSKAKEGSREEIKGREKHVVIGYLQGNGSSTPPRLPLLSNVLKILNSASANDSNPRYTIVALSYRDYWTSSGRASQRGIEKDAQAMLSWAEHTYSESKTDLYLVLWGQSIGAGIASTAAAAYLSSRQHPRDTHNNGGDRPAITAMVLETPFTSVKSMLQALYPQKWLPYRYLHPFLWNQWDSEAALRTIAATCEVEKAPKVLLLPATRDEVVPAEEVGKLQRLCEKLGLEHERNDILGALHTEATTRREGQVAVADFVRKSIRAQ